MNVRFSEISAYAGDRAVVVSMDPSRIIKGYDSLKYVDLPLKHNMIYFGSVSELGRKIDPVKCNFILYEDKKLERDKLDGKNINILMLDDKTAFQQVCRYVKSVFEVQAEIADFSEQLLRLVQDGAKIQRILDLSYQVFRNPLVLMDPTLCLIGSAGTDTMDNEPIVEHLLEQGYMPDYYLTEVMKEESELRGDEKNYIIWEKDFINHRVFAGRIVFNNRLVGYLKIFECNRRFDEDRDLKLLIAACQYLAIRMKISSSTNDPGNPYVEALLIDILDRKLTDRETIRQRGHLYNMELRQHKVAVAVELEEKFENNDKLYLVKQKLQYHFNRNTAIIYGRSIIVLYDKDLPEELFDKNRMELFTALLETINCRAAFSLPFKNLYDFRKYYVQASTCLQIAGRMRVSDRVILYSDYIINHMFLRFAEVLDLRDLVHPFVEELLLLDEQKGSEMVATLFSYLKHNQDISLTAKDMCVHYNTLKYRINRILEMSGLDFSRPQTVFMLNISERALELMRLLESNDSNKLHISG